MATLRPETSRSRIGAYPAQWEREHDRPRMARPSDRPAPRAGCCQPVDFSLELCEGVHCVDLGESFRTHILLQNLAPIQPRTSPTKFDHLAWCPVDAGDTSCNYWALAERLAKAGRQPLQTWRNLANFWPTSGQILFLRRVSVLSFVVKAYNY